MLLRTDSDRTRVDGSTTVLSVEFSQEHFESECDFLSVCRALYTCLDAIYSPMASRRLYWFYMNTINVMVEIYQKYFYCYCVKGIQ